MKKNIFALLFVLTLVVVGTVVIRTNGTCDESITTVPLKSIVTAFDVEQDAVLSRVHIEESCTVGKTTYYVVEYEGEQLLLFMSGIGPSEATRTTEKTLSTFNVTLLVFSGIAGAVDTSLTIGDTIVAREWLDDEGDDAIQVPDMHLQQARQESIRIVEKGISVDYFVTDTTVLPQGVSIVDMETHDVAAVAQTHNVPFIAFRSISDFADGSESTTKFVTAAGNSADTALTFLSQR